MKKSQLVASLCLFASLRVAYAEPSSSTQSVSNRGFVALLEKDGHYRVGIAGTSWSLEGTLPEAATVLPAGAGTDRLGAYHELRARSADGHLESIRVYTAKPLVMFVEKWEKGGSADAAFPAFKSLPTDAKKYSFERVAFSHYEFNTLGPEGPWVLFGQGHTVVLSPADHFQISSMTAGSDGVAASGINPKVGEIPAGFEHGTLLAAGAGINDTLGTWGAGLLALGGKKPVGIDADPVLSKFGYWTDNGAKYYYKFASNLDYPGTLVAIKTAFANAGVPLGYMQLDSWFYPKGNPPSWDNGGGDLPHGEDVYRADKQLFPQGLAAFHARIGLPFVTHARWVSPTSPYRTEYKMSNNVIIDPKFWDGTAKYLKDSGVITYEQDWLDHNASTEMKVGPPSAFLNQMAHAMQSEGLTMQYCMAPPSDYMATTLYPNLATIRTSDDRFERARWDAFLYDSRLATALGAQPWADVFMSPERGNLLLATLSGGPVGTGDALDGLDAENLHKVVRSDGVIVKPDVGVRPMDRIYVEDADGKNAPMVAVGYSGAIEHPSAAYVFSYPRNGDDKEVSVPLDEIAIGGPAVVYDWVSKRAQVVQPGGTLKISFNGQSHDGGTDKTGSPDADQWGYQVVVPMHGQLALFGDEDQFVMQGRGRVASVTGSGSEIRAEVRFAVGERARFFVGYAGKKPEVHALRGKAELVGYDAATKIYRVQVSAGARNGAEFAVR